MSNVSGLNWRDLLGGEDLIWRILGALTIPFIVDMLGRDESILLWMLSKYFWLSLAYGSVAAFILISYVKCITYALIQKYPGTVKRTERIILQIVFGIFLSSVAIHLFMYLQDSFLLVDSIFNSTWLLYEFPFIIIIVILINVIYLYYFSGKSEDKLPDSEPIEPKQKSVLIALKGHKIYPIPVDNIAFIYREDNLNRIVTFNNEQYTIDASLEDIIDKLNDQLFFRANRQYIVSFKACQSLSVIENNKLELNLNTLQDPKIIISQKTSPSFKIWMNR